MCPSRLQTNNNYWNNYCATTICVRACILGSCLFAMQLSLNWICLLKMCMSDVYKSACAFFFVCFHSKDQFEVVCLVDLSPAPVPIYGHLVQADSNLASSQVTTFPFTSSPANHGSQLMSGRWVESEARSTQGPGELLLRHTHMHTNIHTHTQTYTSAKAALANGKAKPLMLWLINKKRLKRNTGV